MDFCTDCLVSQMCSENSHPTTHKFAVVRGGDEAAVSSSDSESGESSEKDEDCSSSGGSGGSVSDLEMDENSNSFPTSKMEADMKSDSEEMSSMNVLEDTPYDYLCSVINKADVS